MRRLLRKDLMWGLVAMSALSVSARSAPVSGNPNADGWDFSGNSLNLGTFTYTNSTDYGKLFNFDVYYTTFSLESGSALLGNG